MSRHLHSPIVLSLMSLAALAVFVAPAAAREDGPTRITVSYADLNLDTEAGASVLLRRIEQAGREACGFDRSAKGMVRHTARACYKKAVTRAVATVGAPVLTHMFAEREAGPTLVASR